MENNIPKNSMIKMGGDKAKQPATYECHSNDLTSTLQDLLKILTENLQEVEQTESVANSAHKNRSLL